MQLLCVEDLKIVVREGHSPRTYTGKTIQDHAAIRQQLLFFFIQYQLKMWSDSSQTLFLVILPFISKDSFVAEVHILWILKLNIQEK